MMLVKYPYQRTAKILQLEFACDEPLKGGTKNAQCGSNVLIKLGPDRYECASCGTKYVGNLE